VQTTLDPAPSHHRPGLDGTYVSTDRPAGARPAGSRRALPCRVQDPDLWFAESPTQLEQAKSLCTECPVRAACLAGALDRGEPWGVWGGEIFDRGVVIARKRPRGRPRKVRTGEAA
jgi:WhiB family redox-sensing transcriptional regulator